MDVLPSPTPTLDAFSAIYAQHAAYVVRTLRRLGAPERDVEDLAHDTFVVLYRRWGRFDPSRPIRPWLFGIAFRLLADVRRKAAHHRERLQAPPESASVEPRAEACIEATEAQALVHRALNALPAEQRAIFVLHELEEEPVVTAAAALDVPLNTAYSRLRLARRRFAERVRELRSAEGERA